MLPQLSTDYPQPSGLMEHRVRTLELAVTEKGLLDARAIDECLAIGGFEIGAIHGAEVVKSSSSNEVTEGGETAFFWAAGLRFTEVWHSKVFALVLALHRHGAFTWPEWMATFPTCLAPQHPRSVGEAVSMYYRQCFDTLEKLLAHKKA